MRSTAGLEWSGFESAGAVFVLWQLRLCFDGVIEVGRQFAASPAIALIPLLGGGAVDSLWEVILSTVLNAVLGSPSSLSNTTSNTPS